MRAAALMRAGELVIVPTDTIYGIATVMIDECTIQHLYQVRQREQEPALPFIIAGEDELARVARPSPTALRLAHRFWPGPLTLILPSAADLPAYARAYPVAVRVPSFPSLIPLLDAVGGCMLITGAIRPGYPPAITAQEAAALFHDDVALILNGGTALYGVPSTILNCIPDPPVIVRRGPIPERKIWRALGLAGPSTSPETP